MEIQFINQLLKVIKEAMEWLQQLYEAARKGGLPPFDLLPQKTAVELTTAHNDFADDEAIRLAYRRMLGRNRQRRYRQRQRQARENYKTVAGSEAAIAGIKETVTGDVTAVTKTETAITGDAKYVTGNAKTITCDVSDANSVTGDAVTQNGDAAAKNEKESKKRKKQRKEVNKKQKSKTNIADAMPNSARARLREDENNGPENATGNCLPFVPPEAKKSSVIPTAELPEACRNVVRAWNKLPLAKKLSGLFPSLVKRLHYLLETYGEDTVHNAIASIANSPFLLGKSKNNRGWVIHFSWLMEPENLEKILSGQYQDETPRRHCLFQPGDELQPIPEGFYGTVVY